MARRFLWRGNIVRYISLSHKPAGATPPTAHFHRDTHRTTALPPCPTSSQHKTCAFFSPQCSYLILFLQYSSNGFLTAEVFQLTFKRWEVNREGAETWVPCCRCSFIIQTGLSGRTSLKKMQSGVGPSGHPQSQTEVSRDLDIWAQSYCVQNCFLSYSCSPHQGFHRSLHRRRLKRSVSSHIGTSGRHEWIMQWNSGVVPCIFWQQIYFQWSFNLM